MFWGKSKKLVEVLVSFSESCTEGMSEFESAIRQFYDTGVDGKFAFSSDKVKNSEDTADKKGNVFQIIPNA